MMVSWCWWWSYYLWMMGNMNLYCISEENSVDEHCLSFHHEIGTESYWGILCSSWWSLWIQYGFMLRDITSSSLGCKLMIIYVFHSWFSKLGNRIWGIVLVCQLIIIDVTKINQLTYVDFTSFSEGGTNKHLWQTNDQNASCWREAIQNSVRVIYSGSLRQTVTTCLGCLSMFLAIDFWINDWINSSDFWINSQVMKNPRSGYRSVRPSEIVVMGQMEKLPVDLLKGSPPPKERKHTIYIYI